MSLQLEVVITSNFSCCCLFYLRKFPVCHWKIQLVCSVPLEIKFWALCHWLCFLMCYIPLPLDFNSNGVKRPLNRGWMTKIPLVGGLKIIKTLCKWYITRSKKTSIHAAFRWKINHRDEIFKFHYKLMEMFIQPLLDVQAYIYHWK
jgi:hypothetical protein